MKNVIMAFSQSSIVIIVITLVLFAVALFVKGFTHDLLLESAVFLVSVKLIHMGYSNHKAVEGVNAKLDSILESKELIDKTFGDQTPQN